VEELETAEKGLAEAKALMSTYDNYVRLENTEIPKIEAEMKSLASKLAEANKGVDQVCLWYMWLIVARCNRQ
jgi:hypothetical protein